jgi:hypothetical protein
MLCNFQSSQASIALLQNNSAYLERVSSFLNFDRLFYVLKLSLLALFFSFVGFAAYF